MSDISRLERLLEQIVEQNDAIIDLLRDGNYHSKEIIGELKWVSNHSFAKRVTDALDAIEANTTALDTIASNTA